jgi:hypothetical protein
MHLYLNICFLWYGLQLIYHVIFCMPCKSKRFEPAMDNAETIVMLMFFSQTQCLKVCPNSRANFCLRTHTLFRFLNNQNHGTLWKTKSAQELNGECVFFPRAPEMPELPNGTDISSSQCAIYWLQTTRTMIRVWTCRGILGVYDANLLFLLI